LKTLISFNAATQLSILLFALVILFHAAILVGIIFFDYAPIDFLWGGRMKTPEELLVFEILSLIVSSFCLVVVLIKSDRLRVPSLKRMSGFILWVLFILFLLNTVGNIFAKTSFEKLFSIVTIALAILCLRLAMEKESST